MIVLPEEQEALCTQQNTAVQVLCLCCACGQHSQCTVCMCVLGQGCIEAPWDNMGTTVRGTSAPLLLTFNSFLLVVSSGTFDCSPSYHPTFHCDPVKGGKPQLKKLWCQPLWWSHPWATERSHTLSALWLFYASVAGKKKATELQELSKHWCILF